MCNSDRIKPRRYSFRRTQPQTTLPNMKNERAPRVNRTGSQKAPRLWRLESPKAPATVRAAALAADLIMLPDSHVRK